MFKVLEFTKSGLYICSSRGFLEIKDEKVETKIPIDDIKSIILSGHGQTITTVALRELLDHKVSIVVCNDKFMPVGLMLPSFGSGMLNKRIHLQIKMSEPFKKNIWKEIIKRKISFQAEVLKYFFNDDLGLVNFSKSVLSGDSDNKEAQAAKRYWPRLFENFKRSDDSNSINSALDYGYIVLRSCVSRAVVAQGLHPSFGVFHNNKENNFCLVDDLIEVFRPLVDFKIKTLFLENTYKEINPDLKKKIVQFLYEDLKQENMETVPLVRSVEILINSFCNALEVNECNLQFPASIIPKNN